MPSDEGEFDFAADGLQLIAPGTIFAEAIGGATSRCCATGTVECTQFAGETTVSFNKVVPSFNGQVGAGANGKVAVLGISDLLGSAEANLTVSGTFQGTGLDFQHVLDGAVADGDTFTGGTLTLKAPTFSGKVTLNLKVSGNTKGNAGIVIVGANANGFLTKEYTIRQTFQDVKIQLNGSRAEINAEIQQRVAAMAETVAQATSQNLATQFSGGGQGDLRLPVTIPGSGRNGIADATSKVIGNIKGTFSRIKLPGPPNLSRLRLPFCPRNDAP